MELHSPTVFVPKLDVQAFSMENVVSKSVAYSVPGIRWVTLYLAFVTLALRLLGAPAMFQLLMDCRFQPNCAYAIAYL